MRELLVIVPLTLPALLMLSVRPACGAYDPPSYRCGKCDICRREIREDD